MIIKTIHIRNFRCLKDVVLNCDPLTILVGPNGSGKSALLKALQLFYSTDIEYEESDFYNNDTSEDITITIRFNSLSHHEKELFKPYLDGEELIVEKVLSFPQTRISQRYYGNKLQNSDFDAFRTATGTDLRREYEKLRSMDKYRAFLPYQNREVAENILSTWELEHSEYCKRIRDDGQFFGFRNVGVSKLERFTKFTFIPAVYEASIEATETKGSAISEMMEIVVKSALANNPELRRLEEMAQEQYQKAIDPNNIPELIGLEKKLTDSLRWFVPDTEVDISWEQGMGMQINLPRSFIKLTEDGYTTTVDRTGHGLQRAFILTMFHHLAIVQASQKEEDKEVGERPSMPSFIFGIEEPELYQHPDRQRHFTNTLLRLSSGGIEGLTEQIQIIYSTHSPLMIEPDRIDNIRIFRKIESREKMPKDTKISFTTLGKLARDLEIACGEPEGTFTESALRPRLHAVMTPRMNESYFSRLVVLVEGLRDRAIILGATLALGYDLESVGISVVDCNGKCNIDRPLTILKNLEIPFYVIFDADRGGRDPRVHANHELLRLLNHEVVDYPDAITDNFACCETNLQDRLRREIGEDNYLEILQKYCDQCGLGDVEHAILIPNTLKALIEEGHKRERRSTTIESIVNKIIIKFNHL
jgi:predicted ATP-dependent endonuclease of OLD family